MNKRCFIAINLNAENKLELAKIISQLKKTYSNPNIKYVKPESVHLTLHFLAYLDDNQIEKVKSAIDDIAEKHKPFIIKTSDFGGFPSLKYPQVIFIKGGGEIEEAMKIQKKLGEKLSSLGFPIDSRPWQAHFTLARLPKPIKIENLGMDLEEIKINVSSIELMQSQLTPDGAKYSALYTKNLGKKSI